MNHTDNKASTTSSNKLVNNVSFLAIAITLFTFIITFNATVLKTNDFLAIQLVCSIPILISSCFTSTKLGYTKRIFAWKNYNYILFTFGNILLINSIGILIAELVSLKIGLIYFIVNILVIIIYSVIRIHFENPNIKTRLYKDTLALGLIIIFGILPILGIL
ncbi:MAG: hypothetical protein WCX82_02090 [archaeon]